MRSFRTPALALAVVLRVRALQTPPPSHGPMRRSSRIRSGGRLRDHVIAAGDTRALLDRLPDGARVQRFDAEHALNAEAYAAQAAFLAEYLAFDTGGFVAPPPPG